MIWVIGMFVTTVLVITYRHKAVVVASYYEGYRACARDAVRALKTVEVKSMENAPIGELVAGCVRAETAHECGMRVRELAQQIGRPV